MNHDFYYKGNSIDIEIKSGTITIYQVDINSPGSFLQTNISISEGPDLEVLYNMIGELLTSRYQKDIVSLPLPEEVDYGI